jgi:hypothetical protein
MFILGCKAPNVPLVANLSMEGSVKHGSFFLL